MCGSGTRRGLRMRDLFTQAVIIPARIGPRTSGIGLSPAYRICDFGSAIGGLAYGGVHVKLPVEKQLPWLMALFAVPLAGHLFAGGPWTIVPLAFAAGLLIAPSMTGMTILVSRHAPAAYATEAFTWSATAIVTGIGAGMAAGGALVERFGAKSAIALCCVSALAGAALSLAMRRR